jgi:hypothetical protein
VQKTLIVGVLGRGNLQRAFPVDVPMVSSSMIVVAADGECLTCSGFSLGETVHLGNFEFIIDYFGDLSHSPRRGDVGSAFMGSTSQRSIYPLEGHDRGLHRGVPHGVKREGELLPLIS